MPLLKLKRLQPLNAAILYSNKLGQQNCCPSCVFARKLHQSPTLINAQRKSNFLKSNHIIPYTIHKCKHFDVFDPEDGVHNSKSVFRQRHTTAEGGVEFEREDGRRKVLPLGQRLSESLSDERFDSRDLLRELLKEKDPKAVSDEDWVFIKNEISKGMRMPWDNFCMSIFYEDDLLPFGQSLMSYLERVTTPNRFVMTYFIALLGRNALADPKIDRMTKEYYDMFMAKNDIIDPVTMKVSI